MVMILKDYFGQKYSSKLDKYFDRWKSKVVSAQKFDLVCLDKTKDILMDELQQSIKINENLSK